MHYNHNVMNTRLSPLDLFYSGIHPWFGVFLVAVVWIATGSPACAAPFIPGSDAQVLETLPTKAGDPVARELRELRAALAKNPGDLGRAIVLAQRYIDLASAEGDPRYVGYAEAVIRPWLKADIPVEIQFTRALLRQYRHDFINAISDLESVLARSPGHADALAWKWALYVVMADYDKARDGCEKRRGIASGASFAACVASIDSLTGKAGEAYASLDAALKREPDHSADFRQWALTRLAEFALRAGDKVKAERHFKEAIASGVTDGYVLGAYSDLLLDENRPREVIALLKDWTRSDILLLRLAIAEKMLSTPTATAWAQVLSDRFADSALRGDKLHLAEEARFELVLKNNPTRAVELAVENWMALQREPRDARILMEAALAAKTPEAARPAMDWVSRNHYQESPYADLNKALGKLVK